MPIKDKVKSNGLLRKGSFIWSKKVACPFRLWLSIPVISLTEIIRFILLTQNDINNTLSSTAITIWTGPKNDQYPFHGLS